MTDSPGLAEMILTVLLLAAVVGMACNSDRQPLPDPETAGTGKVLGLAFDCLQVSNLERSIEYYRALGFTVSGDTSPPWIEDEAANSLYKTPGARFRTATLKMNSTVHFQGSCAKPGSGSFVQAVRRLIFNPGRTCIP